MSNSRLSDYIQLAISAVRAAYGDFSGLVVKGVKYLPKIIAALSAVVIIIVILPAIFIQSLFTGDSTTPSGTFSEIAMESLQYNEDWITVLTIAQTRKVLTGSMKADLVEAYKVLKDNKISEYLKTNIDGTGDAMEVYKQNLELMKNMLSGYAGYEFFYDETPVSSSWKYVRKRYSDEHGFNVLEATIKTENGESKEVIYSSNDVVNFREDEGIFKIKYRKFCLKAYFPITDKYEASYSNDFGAGRVHDGKAASHEGNDIFVARNTPIIAIEDCKISKIGWNSFGGWRILLESNDGHREYYYAHMENYAEKLQKYMDMSGKVYNNPGIDVKAGELIGYVGSSGSFNSETPPGADTGTPPHIHLQMWVVSKGWFFEKKTLINPYYCLKLLEQNKYNEDIRLNAEKVETEGL